MAAITGTNGKTTTSRMVAHILKMSGKRTGLTTTDGIYILRRDDEQNLWALTLYKQSESLPALDVGRKPRMH